MDKTSTDSDYDRLFIGQDIRQDGAEIWWKPANSGICFPDDSSIAGSILVMKSGAMNIRFNGKDDLPYLLVMDEQGVRIVCTEDSWVEGDETKNYEVAWDGGKNVW